MIVEDKEYYSSPYYFLLKNKGNYHQLYFSSEKTLVEARKKDSAIKVPKERIKAVKTYLDKLLKTKQKKSTKDMQGELEELVNSDGALSNSKIPILDPKLHPRKTMDQTVAAARITNDPISRGYRTYYGESVDDINEVNMEDAFGYEETKDMDGKDTYNYFKKELEMEPEDAKERTKQQGKDPSGKRDEKSKYKNDKNFIAKMTISEIQRQKMIKMVEDILMGKKSSGDGDVNKKDIEVSKVLKKNLSTIKRQADREGISMSELVKLLRRE